MSVGRPGAHLGGNPDGLHDLCSVAPLFNAEAVCPRMQYGHCVMCAAATAISSLVFLGKAPSAKTLSLNALKAASGSGASAARLRAEALLKGG